MGDSIIEENKKQNDKKKGPSQSTHDEFIKKEDSWHPNPKRNGESFFSKRGHGGRWRGSRGRGDFRGRGSFRGRGGGSHGDTHQRYEKHHDMHEVTHGPHDNAITIDPENKKKSTTTTTTTAGKENVTQTDNETSSMDKEEDGVTKKKKEKQWKKTSENETLETPKEEGPKKEKSKQRKSKKKEQPSLSTSSSGEHASKDTTKKEESSSVVDQPLKNKKKKKQKDVIETENDDGSMKKESIESNEPSADQQKKKRKKKSKKEKEESTDNNDKSITFQETSTHKKSSVTNEEKVSSKKKTDRMKEQQKQKFGTSVSSKMQHLAHDRSLPIEISEYGGGSRGGRSYRPTHGTSTSFNFRSNYNNVRKHEEEPLVLSFHDGQVDQFHFASDDLVTDHHHPHFQQQDGSSEGDRILSESIIERRPPPPPPSTTLSSSNKDFHSRKPREGQQQQQSRGGSRSHHYIHPDDRNPQNRRTLFSPYMNKESILKEIEQGKLIQGNLRINKRNRSDAYVTSDHLDHDIFIFGQRDRNRGLEGDSVAVRLLDVEKIWQLKKEKMRKRDAEKATTANEEENETQGIETKEEPVEDEDMDKSKPKYCGEIVGILDRPKDQKFAGILYVERPHHTNNKDQPQNNDNEKSKQPHFVWFKPTDKRTPLIAIPVERAPLDVFEKANDYENTLLTATITKWSIFGQHPIGQIIGYLGPVGTVVSETQAILADNQVKDESFSNHALGGLPKTPWNIPQIEYKIRRDLTDTRIFTIDPATAKEEGHFEVGVHIADVSYFLRKYSPLDTEARERGTSTYLVNRVIPMLPNLLCEELCSLNPGVERLAFSVIWKMDSTGNIIDTWFGRTIIKSCAKLAYDDAQSVIDGHGLPKTSIIMGYSRSSVEQDITYLYQLSKHMRKRRFENGALSINSIRLCFKLNEAGEPEDVWIYELKEANRLIEEFMLCANMSVAQKICSRFPEEALLRRHEPPIERRLTEFLKLSEELGYELDGSSAGNLQASFNAIQDDHVRSVLTVMAIKPMQRAKYFCTGTLDVSKYTHYALNVPLYTHFTSPIRRYADVIVHRQLEAALREAGSCGYNKKEAQEIAVQCNRCRDGAKNAQDQNIELYLAHYLNNLTRSQGSIIRPAIVVQVLSDAFDIIVPEYGIEKRIHTDKLPLHRHVFHASDLSMDVYWKKGEMVTTFGGEEEEEGEESIPHDSVMPGEKEDIKDPKQYVEDDDVNDPPFPGIPVVKSDDIKQVASSEDINESTGMQRFKVFTTFDVLIQVNMQRSPPIINVYPINPFAQRP
ncbi:hypothetical protein INT45_006507 [Circinella minor]|uniref:DIS3-like exonuclease 2 n=1 Tax=Circinella minor TaxID=1195481 RepID=A0A8H7VNB9_9FUNG|nr:hypothetical protein INT45_006507 [Circinella minor]